MNLLIRIRNAFLKMFGDIKVFKFPFFVLYDPSSYKVKGDDVRNVISQIKDGDILLRGYSNYLDGWFIPGFFSHAGLYIGKTKKSVQTVIHAMADGVFMEDVINFCRCDYLVILRRNTKIEPTLNSDSFKRVYDKAMESLGKGYDFAFDFSDIGNLSCTELVYVCNADAMPKYDVFIKRRNVLFMKKEMLIPDDFLTSKFDIIFKSNSVKKSTLDTIIAKNSTLLVFSRLSKLMELF